MIFFKIVWHPTQSTCKPTTYQHHDISSPHKTWNQFRTRIHVSMLRLSFMATHHAIPTTITTLYRRLRKCLPFPPSWMFQGIKFELHVQHNLLLYGAVSISGNYADTTELPCFFDGTVALCRSNTVHVGIRRSYLHCYLATFITIGYRIHTFNMDLLSTLIHSTQLLWATSPATSQVILLRLNSVSFLLLILY